MEAKELRIGNLAMLDNDILEVSAIKEAVDLENEHRIFFKNEHRNKPASHIKPIALTEEWLLKFGFEKEDRTESKSHGSYFSMHILDYKYCLAFADFRNDWGFYQEYTDSPFEEDYGKKHFVSCGITSVHQLQNLYFELTGNELTIKE